MRERDHSANARLQGSSPEIQSLLKERARRAQAKLAGPPQGDCVVLTFQSGGDSFALEIGFISHVVRVGPICSLPGAPSFLRGVANIRAEMLPIIDLRELLSLPRRPSPPEGQLIVARYEDRRPAFLVDECGTIRRLREEECGQVPANLPLRTRSMGRFFTSDGVLVLNGAALLGGDEILINT